MSLLDFQENIDALFGYWKRELKDAKYWKDNHEGWIRCHPEEDIASRKGYIRTLRRDMKRRKRLVERFEKRILYCRSMLREIYHEVNLKTEKLSLLIGDVNDFKGINTVTPKLRDKLHVFFGVK